MPEPNSIPEGANGARNIDHAPHGKRIAATTPVEMAEALKAQNHVTFLMNSSDEVRRKVLVGI
jgi:hypothetical protein